MLAALLLSKPQAAALGAAQAMAQWYENIAPALFPFLALMPLLTCEEAAGVYERALGRVMKTLFRLPGAAAPAMVIGMVAGTPAGAIAARRIAARSGMNQGQLLRLVAVTSGLSPAFLIGGIGAGMLDNMQMGWVLLRAQLLCQTTMALLLRRAWPGRVKPVLEAARKSEEQPVREAVFAVLTICGYMALFGALTFAVRYFLGRGIADALLCVLDMPSGVRLLTASGMSDTKRMILLAALCGFGGVCIGVQTLGALAGCGIRAMELFELRLCAAVLNAVYTALQLRLLDGRGMDFLAEISGISALQTAALAVVALSVPVLVKIGKSIS